MIPEPGVYEARYGWNRRTVAMVIMAAVFVLLAIVPPMSLGLRVATLVFFGGGGLFFAGSVATRRVALRVDASGVTLGGSPVRYQATTWMVPWADIRQIVLWRQRLPYGSSMPYVSLVRREGAPPLGGRRGRWASQMAAQVLTPNVSADTLMASRAVNMWRLDARHLAAAVAQFAPGIRVVDQETGRVIGPVG